MKIASEERRELLNIHFTEYFKPIIDKPLHKLYDNIIESAHTWDIYSTCILWLETWILLGFHEKITEYDFIRQFIDMLKHVVYANPNARPSIEYIEEEISKIFTNVPENTYMKFISEIVTPNH